MNCFKYPLLDNTDKVACELNKDSDKERHPHCPFVLFLYIGSIYRLVVQTGETWVRLDKFPDCIWSQLDTNATLMISSYGSSCG